MKRKPILFFVLIVAYSACLYATYLSERSVTSTGVVISLAISVLFTFIVSLFISSTETSNDPIARAIRINAIRKRKGRPTVNLYTETIDPSLKYKTDLTLEQRFAWFDKLKDIAGPEYHHFLHPPVVDIGFVKSDVELERIESALYDDDWWFFDIDRYLDVDMLITEYPELDFRRFKQSFT